MKLYLWEPADIESEYLTGGFSYRSDLYADATMLNLMQRYIAIIEEVCWVTVHLFLINGFRSPWTRTSICNDFTQSSMPRFRS